MSPGVKGSCTCSAPALTGGTESRATPPAGPRPLFPECAPSRCARISVRMWPRLSGCGCVLAASGLSQSPRAASVRGRGVRACPRGGSAQASGARLVEPSVRSRARGARRAERGGGRLGSARKDAGPQVCGRPGSTRGRGRARRGSPRPPGWRRARVPAAAPPPLPPPASSSFPAPRARASRGRPGGAAPPRPARLAPTPPPPSRRSGQTESAGEPAGQVGASRPRRAQVRREGSHGGHSSAGGTAPGGRSSVASAFFPLDAAWPFLGNSFALADSSAGGAEIGRSPFHWSAARSLAASCPQISSPPSPAPLVAA